MKSLLKDLFMGRIDVMGSMPFKGKNNVASEVLFIKTLTSEQKEQYEELLNGLRTECRLEYEYSFVTGFKMGLRLLLECLSDTMEDEDSSDSL